MLKSNKQAFTLVEILIAITVLAVTLTAMANLVIVTMRANNSNENTLTAYYLAEQGLEAMRNVRDTNWLQNYAWNTDFDCVVGQEDFYLIVDENTEYRIGIFNFGDGLFDRTSLLSVDHDPWKVETISESSLESGAKLYKISESEGYTRYSYDNSGDESLFSRYLVIHYNSCDDEVVEITAVVSWNERGNDREVTLKTYLTDWQS